MLVDGVHFCINKLSHPKWNQSAHYNPHKYNNASFEYKMDISLVDDQPLCMRGLFPARWNDFSIFKERNPLVDLQQRSQKAVGDKGYNGPLDYCNTFNVKDNKKARLRNIELNTK